MKSIILGFLFTVSTLSAQDIVPFLLEKESHSILKKSQTSLEIFDHKNFITRKNYTIIIKNKFAEDLKNIFIYYNNFRKVKSANVIIRDMDGNEIEKYKLKDFDDRVSGFSNIDSDGRIKLLRPPIASYPFEMEVTYEIHHTASLFYDFWQPQDFKMRIVDAQLKVIDHTRSNLRYFTKNIVEPKKSKNSEGTIYLWELKNQTPLSRESFNGEWEDYFATVILAPVKFQKDKYKGEMSTWAGFGEWIVQLNTPRNTFDENDINDLKNLGLQKKTPLETLKNIYRFLQENTRYISIQIGIGGHQPMETKTVHEKKYGDCKALSFYTQSLLALYDIKSHYTLINAGKEKKDLEEDFPSPYFNHAILTVPIEKDTIFLECTSQTNPFGYAGTFTGNRKALLIDGERSKIINTQQYTSENNRQDSKINIDLNLTDGSSIVHMEKKYCGTEIEYKGFWHLYQEAQRKKTDWVYDTFNWGGAIKIDSLSFMPLKGDVFPEGGFNLLFSNKKEGVKRGNRIFLSPVKYLTRSPQIPKENERKTPIRIRFGYAVKDRIVYKVGATDFSIENLKESVQIETVFGKYTLAIEKREATIVLNRSFRLNGGVYSSDEFDAFKVFLTEIRKNDRSKLVVKVL